MNQEREIKMQKQMKDAATYHKKLYSYNELMAKRFPPNKWTVDKLIPAGGITILSALPGSYKTWLLLHIVTSVAIGAPVFDQFDTDRAKILVIDEENGARLLQERIKLLDNGVDLPIQFMFDEDFSTEETEVSKLIKYCKSQDIKFVTIDSLIRIHKGNENDAGEMARVFKQLKRFSAAGITLLITHHNRKPSSNSTGGSQEMRGSSDILAALDCHLALSRNDNRLKLTQTKVRFNEEMPPIDLRVNQEDEIVSFVYEGTLKPALSKRTIIQNQILEVLNIRGVLNQNEILQALQDYDTKVSINTLREILTVMTNDGRVLKGSGERNSFNFSVAKPKVI